MGSLNKKLPTFWNLNSSINNINMWVKFWHMIFYDFGPAQYFNNYSRKPKLFNSNQWIKIYLL